MYKRICTKIPFPNIYRSWDTYLLYTSKITGKITSEHAEKTFLTHWPAFYARCNGILYHEQAMQIPYTRFYKPFFNYYNLRPPIWVSFNVERWLYLSHSLTFVNTCRPILRLVYSENISVMKLNAHCCCGNTGGKW